MNANETSTFSATDFPAGGSVGQKLAHVMKCAMLQPVAGDWQPWQFRLGDGEVELFVRRHNVSSEEFDDRAVMMRCGAALFHLRLALRHFNCMGKLEFFPDFSRPEIVARARYGFGMSGDMTDAALFQAMARPEEPRALSEGPLTDSVLESFHRLGQGDKTWMEFSQSDASRNRLVSLAEMDAPIASPFTSGVTQRTRPWLTFMVRANPAGKFTVEAGMRQAREMSALAVIKTKTDDKHGWLATGQMMAHARLQALARKIPFYLFNRPFQKKQVREELRTSIGHKGFAQTIIGFGLRAVDARFTTAGMQPMMERAESRATFPTRLGMR